MIVKDLKGIYKAKDKQQAQERFKIFNRKECEMGRQEIKRIKK